MDAVACRRSAPLPRLETTTWPYECKTVHAHPHMHDILTTSDSLCILKGGLRALAAAHYAPGEANCPVAFSHSASHSFCPLLPPQLTSLSSFFSLEEFRSSRRAPGSGSQRGARGPERSHLAGLL